MNLISEERRIKWEDWSLYKGCLYTEVFTEAWGGQGRLPSLKDALNDG